MSDEYKLKLYKHIENRARLAVSFHNRLWENIFIPTNSRKLDWRLTVTSGSENILYIILAFQSDKQGDQEQIIAIFVHCCRKNAFVNLNSERYPERYLNISSSDDHYATAYEMFYSYFKDVFTKESCPVKLNNYVQEYLSTLCL